jgi:hypothetical protein
MHIVIRTEIRIPLFFVLLTLVVVYFRYFGIAASYFWVLLIFLLPFCVGVFELEE